MNTYQQKFENALRRTLDLGLKTPCVVYDQTRYLNNISMKRLLTAVSRRFGGLSAEWLLDQCLDVHYQIIPLIQQETDAQAYFTIGSIYAPPDTLFEITEEHISDLLHKGMQDRFIDIHGWITLSSMEIFDFTLMTTLGWETASKTGGGGVIAGHPSELTRWLDYQPMLIGTDFLTRIGAIAEN
jgi:hypothetical protein